jgi:hypothetical protein
VKLKKRERARREVEKKVKGEDSNTEIIKKQLY